MRLRLLAAVTGLAALAAAPRAALRVAAAQVGPQNVSHLVWIDRAGKRLNVVDGPANERAVELSPDGRRAAVSLLTASRQTRDIAIVDLATGTRTKLTDDDGDKLFAIWTPDGSRIVFDRDQRSPSGSRNIYQKNADGAGADTLLFGDQRPKWPLSISNDGRYLAFVTVNSLGVSQGIEFRTQDIEVLPLTGANRKPVPFQQSPDTESYPRFSPDGRWIAYGSDQELYVAPFPGPGRAVQVSSSPGTLPRWRRDGKELFFVTASGTAMTMNAAPVTVQGPTIECGPAARLFEFDALATGFYPYDVSADGQRFLVDVTVTTATLTPKSIALTLFARPRHDE